MKKTLLIIVVFLLLFALIAVYSKQKQSQFFTDNKEVTSPTQNQVAEVQQPTKTITVTAQNNSFSPNAFMVGQTETLVLQVNAVDKDYQFKVEGYDRLDTTFSKGLVKNHIIDKLGIGEYTYTCGSDCKGTITIEPEKD